MDQPQSTTPPRATIPVPPNAPKKPKPTSNSTHTNIGTEESELDATQKGLALHFTYTSRVLVLE
jgi:hypothetical protein